MTRQPLPHPSVLPLDGGINFRDRETKVLPDGGKIKLKPAVPCGALDRPERQRLNPPDRAESVSNPGLPRQRRNC